MTKKYQIIAALILSTLIVGLIYYQLGGTTSLDFEMTTKDKLTIYGAPFQGKYDDPKIELLFIKAREHVVAHSNSSLAIVNYFLQDKDSVNQFIGFVSEENFDLPNIQMKEVSFVKTEILAHNMVMPRPDVVQEEALSFANLNGLKLDDFSIEIYHDERSLEILFPTKAN
jgi:hypothetical protein